MKTFAAAVPGAELRADPEDIDAAEPIGSAGLQYLRASGLAQARLQIAILSGNRRRALCEIDRLVEIDRRLAHLVEHGEPGCRKVSGALLDEHLARQQRAIATEKLALGAAIEFPRLPGRSDSEELLPVAEDEIVAIEDTAFPRKLALAGMWLIGLIALGTALAIAVPMLVAA